MIRSKAIRSKNFNTPLKKNHKFYKTELRLIIVLNFLKIFKHIKLRPLKLNKS